MSCYRCNMKRIKKNDDFGNFIHNHLNNYDDYHICKPCPSIIFRLCSAYCDGKYITAERFAFNGPIKFNKTYKSSYGLPGVRRTEGWPLNPWLGHRGFSVHPGGSPKDPVYRQRMALRFRHRKADLDRTASMGLSSPAAIKWHGAVQPQLCDDSSPPSPEQQGQQLTGIISS